MQIFEIKTFISRKLRSKVEFQSPMISSVGNLQCLSQKCYFLPTSFCISRRRWPKHKLHLLPHVVQQICKKNWKPLVRSLQLVEVWPNSKEKCQTSWFFIMSIYQCQCQNRFLWRILVKKLLTYSTACWTTCCSSNHA